MCPQLEGFLQCSPASGGQDKFEELLQQERAMAAFMGGFSAARAAKVAELEGMQIAGAGRQPLSGRASVSDVPSLPFDESQAR